MGQEEARKALERAQAQLEKVMVATWEPEDREDAVTWAFYAYENAVVAAAEKLGERWTRRHDQKADLAAAPHVSGHLSVDVHDLLTALNRLRQDVPYGEMGADLLDLDLYDLASELDAFVGEVADLVRRP